MLQILLAMAVTFGSAGPVIDGTSELSPRFPLVNNQPVNIPAGNLLVLTITGRRAETAPAPEAQGFALAPGDSFRGFELGIDDLISAVVLYKVADGSEVGEAELSVSASGWSTTRAQLLRYVNQTGQWSLDCAGGSGANVSNGCTIESFGPNMAAGDFVCWAIGGDEVGIFLDGPIISLSGITFGTPTTRDQGPTFTGPGHSSGRADCSVTAVSAPETHQPIWGFQVSGETEGVASGVILRIRQAGEFTGISVGDTITVGITEQLSITATLAVQDTVTVGLSDAVSVQEQTAQKSVQDTITVGISDSVSVFELVDFKEVGDTITVALADEVSVFQETADKSVSDTITVALSDQVTVATTFDSKSVSDTITVAVNELLFVSTSRSIADTIRVAISDFVSVFALNEAKSVFDTATVALTDSVSVFETADVISVADGIAVAIIEFPGMVVTLSVGDDINVGVTDAVSLFELTQDISTPDTISVGLTDSVDTDITLNPVSVSDDIDIGLTDTVSVTVSLFRLDIMFVELGETISLAVTAAVSDTATVGLTDAVAVEVTFIPGNPQIRRFSLTHPLRPVEIGRSGVSIA